MRKLPEKLGGPRWASVAAVLLLTGLTCQAQDTLTNGLVAYWNFDGNFQDSVKDFHGTGQGTNAPTFVEGKAGFGQAVKLDGSDQFVEITGGDENELEFPGGSMSIAGWFKVDAFDTDWQALISKGEGENYRIARRSATNSIAYAGGVGEGADDVPAVDDGNWHHFVAVSDAATNEFGTALYVDGVRYGVNAAQPVLASSDFNLMIGENPGARGREWEGEIDDVAIWNRVLTAAEIATLYNAGTGRPVLVTETNTIPMGLVAYWNFDGDFQDSVKDFHGTGQGTTPPTFVEGKAGFGQAVKLNGDDQFVEITGGDENELEFPGGSMSIAGWFKVDAFDTDWQALISKGEGENYRIARRAATNSIAYAGGVGEGADDVPAVDDGNWHHFVAVSDAATNEFGTALYVDGVRYGVNPAQPVLASSDFNLMIGENPGARGREWEGEIDDIAIWNRVVTPAEVAMLYNGGTGRPVLGAGPPESPVLLHFGFNEGAGTNTVDMANGLVGTLGIGMQLDPTNVPLIVSNSPAGTETDFALSLNAGSETNQAALVVNDTIAPILAFGADAPFTIEAWVNRETGNTRTFEGLAAYGFSYKLGFNEGQLQFTLYGLVDINSGLVVPTGEWHHVAAVWQPGVGVEFFMDGTSVTNIAETRVPRDYQNNYLTIGAENATPAGLVNTFQGLVDRFRIHGAALMPEELDSVAETPKDPLASTVVSYNFNQANYPFPSGGTTARPAVPNPSPAWTSDTPSGEEGDFALSFAPGTQVVVPDPETVVQLDPEDPSFTLQAWVNFEGNPPTRQVLYYNNGPGGAVSFSVFTNRTIFVTTLGVLDRDSNAAIPDDGNWHHIAVVHENLQEFRFYVDAELADTQPYTGSVIFSRTNQVFYIGSEPTFGLQYTGMLDRLSVTKGTLTPEEFDYPAGGGTPSEIAIEITEEGLVITFTGQLQSATSVLGPWTDVEDATSPLTVEPSGDARFFRVVQ